MRVAHYSAALSPQSAARRLEIALCREGIDAYSVVRSGEFGDIQRLPQSLWGKYVRAGGKKLAKALLRHWHGLPSDALWSTCFWGVPVGNAAQFGHPDVLHLHWVADGTASLSSLASVKIPVLWTMHDTWPFTGGCHFVNSCEKYRSGCGQCDLFFKKKAIDPAAQQFFEKEKVYSSFLSAVISPSRAYAERAKNSRLFQGISVRHIPNCIDVSAFMPINMRHARRVLRLPENETLILFGAGGIDQYRKGLDLLMDALSRVAAVATSRFSCVLFGGGRFPDIGNLPFPVTSLGTLAEETTLALAYSAADIFVCPSRQDNLPNTVMESLACGTPVVAFSIGGIPDMVEHGVSGYLATPYDTGDLARGIALLLNDAELRQRMAAAGREKVEREFAMPVVAKQYIALYEDILVGGTT